MTSPYKNDHLDHNIRMFVHVPKYTSRILLSHPSHFQVGNLGLLFFLLFFIFAALGVELFGRLECSDELPCQGLGEHAHFANFGMAFLTLFRVATGDNWNGIMKDTLRDDCDDAADCVRNCCVSTVIAPIFFVIFVLMAQFVLVNVVVAVLMKHLEESHKQMEDDLEIDNQLEREFQKTQNDRDEQQLCLQLTEGDSYLQKRPLAKVSSLPANFTFSTPIFEKKYNLQARRQTVQYLHHALNLTDPRNVNATTSLYDPNNSILERGESSHTDLDEADPDEITFDRPSSASAPSPGPNKKMDNKTWKRKQSKEEVPQKSNNSNRTDVDLSANKESSVKGTPPTQIRPKEREAEVLLLPENIDSQFAKFKLQDSSRRTPQLQSGTRSYSTDSPKTPYLSVPRMTQRSNSNSTKQLFKQAAVEEDPDMDESTLLLPGTSKHSYPIAVKKMSTPSTSIDSSSPTITVIESVIANPGNSLEPPPVEIRKSESTEILRIISERRRFDAPVFENDLGEGVHDKLQSRGDLDTKKEK